MNSPQDTRYRLIQQRLGELESRSSQLVGIEKHYHDSVESAAAAMRTPMVQSAGVNIHRHIVVDRPA